MNEKLYVCKYDANGITNLFARSTGPILTTGFVMIDTLAGLRPAMQQKDFDCALIDNQLEIDNQLPNH